MKIVHINTHDQGGAFQAAHRLMEGQRKLGLDAHILVLYQNLAALKQTKALSAPQNPFTRLIQALRYRRLQKKQALALPSGLAYPFSFPKTVYRVDKDPWVEQADLIHLHWVANFLDYPSFFQNIKKPIVWTLHDMNPFLGGVHYQMEFEEKRKAYAEIEQKALEIKIKALSALASDQLKVVCPSNWLKSKSTQSSILGRFAHLRIPNGLNLKTFSPQNQTEARKHFDLPLDKTLVLFVAQRVEDSRKGIKFLLEALSKIKDTPLELIVLGNSENLPAPRAVHRLGFIQEPSLIALAYAAADLFVIPSLEDNLPNTVLEAMACGKPVVGFEAGGIPDMIEDGITGYLARKADTEDLAYKIQLCLQDPSKSQEMGQRAREKAEENYSLEKQALAYQKIYQELLETV